MPHVCFVPLTGFRVGEEALLELGMTLPGFRQRGSAIAELPALGLLTLAGMTPDDWSCNYHGAAAVDDDVVERILAESPDLVAVSALTASVEEAYELARRLKQAGVPTVLGGLHATVCAEEAQRRHFDAVVVGDGEPVWRRILADVEAKQLAPVYRAPRAGGEFERPAPRFDLLGPRPPRFTLQTQRGCPLACDFCGASRLLGRFRERPIEAIRRELDTICAVSPRPLLELADDNTFAGPRDVDELFDVLRDSGARWFTEADWRIGERPELLARLAESGCVQVLVGVESLVFRYPGFGGKQAELNRIVDALAAVQEAGVAVNGCFIVGADGETRASLDRLVEFLLSADFAEVQITVQTPFPGTGLRERLQREGRLLAKRGWPYYTLFDVTYRPDAMTVAELETGYRDVLRQVYSREATARRERIRREVWRRARRPRA